MLQMDRLALSDQAKGLGTRLPDSASPAAQRPADIRGPVRIIVAEHDTPSMRAAAAYRLGRLPAARNVLMRDAAHMPNRDHPQEFQQIVAEFPDSLPPSAP